MDGDSLGRLIYLVLLGTVIAGYFFAQNRQNLSKTMQQAIVWVLIFIGVIAVIGLWGDIRDDVLPQQNTLVDGRVEVPRSMDGHYYLTLDVNGEPLVFAVDTGASGIVLSQDDATRVGIDINDLAYLGQAQTANGIVRTAQVRLDEIALGELRDRGVTAYVNDGEMDGSLLGMDYLNRFEKIEISGGKLILTR